MSCRCYDTSPCNSCQNGLPCNCPPDYNVNPIPSPCQCCPNGYTYQSPNIQYPNGICISSQGSVSNTCCPPGMTYNSPTKNYANGYCTDSKGNIYSTIPCVSVANPIPCVACDDAITTDCVIYSGVVPLNCGPSPGNIYGIIPGDTLTTILNKMCVANTSVIETILSQIGLNPALGNAFCQLSANCPTGTGGTTPIISSIIVTFP